MWGSQPWNQWALQPSMFNNVPHEEIDWAALAKQWIQMQQASSTEEPVPAQPPGVPLPPPQPPPPPEDYVGEHMPSAPLLKPPLLTDPYRSPMTDVVKPPGVLPEPGPPYVPREPGGTYWHNEWEVSTTGDVDERIWVPPPPPPEVAPVPLLQPEKKTFDYGHVHENPPLTMQTVDYNHVSDHFVYNQMYTTEDPYDQYWSQVAATPMVPPSFLKKDRVATYPTEEDSSHIDAAKRKQLPAWIREGLEKMEQERLKRLEKERAEKEKTERARKAMQQNSPKKGLLVSGGYESSTISMPSKSKFDSDSDNEVDEPAVSFANHGKDSKFLVTPPVEDTRTEEEIQQELMLKVRRTLTEMLLTVTNSEMLAIAREVYQKALSKAPARPLASSTALRSIASGLGSLASYESHSEASASEEEEESSSSEEELRNRILEKKQRFAIKERKILTELKLADEERKQKQKQQSVQDSTPVESEVSNPDSERKLLASLKPDSISEVETTNNKVNSTDPKLDSNAQAFLPLLAPQMHISPHNSPPKFSNSNHTKSSPKSEHIYDTEHDDKIPLHKAKKLEKDLKSESSSSSDSESDSSSSSSKSSYSHSDKKSNEKRAKMISKKQSNKDIKKQKKQNRSISPNKKYNNKKSRDNSSDSSYKSSKYHSYSKGKRSKKRLKDKSRGRSESSRSSNSSERTLKRRSFRTRRRSSDQQRQRSQSYDRYRKARKSRSISRHRGTRSRSRSRHDSHSSRSRYRDEVRKSKKDRRHSDSRSSSRTPPKRYRRKSRSPSSDRGRHLKKSKIRSRDR